MSIEEMNRIFSLQKAAYSPSKMMSYAQRMDMMDRIDQMVRKYIPEINKAMVEDFGSRPEEMVLLGDIYPILSHIQHSKKGLKNWMKPARQKDGFLGLLGQRTYINHEPLGVVGVVTPFNAPLSLAFGPAIDAISAGNRVMIKFSEDNPAIAELSHKMVEEFFDESEIAVISGGLEIAKAFAELPWDSLFFTGGTEVGKKIMTAAGPNLAPVILELGGKSPCFVLEDADVELAAEKIGILRLMNGGQVCISGDYALMPKKHVDLFVKTAMKAERDKFPTIMNNEKYTSIINDRQYDRIVSWIEEAREAGAKIIQASRPNEILPNKERRKIPLTIIVDPDPSLKVAQEEIFGPVLTIFTYERLEEAIEIVNAKPKALALYIFGKNRRKIDQIVAQTSAGGVTINDVMMHAGTQTMGFGGVGASGMGRYKGGEIGFEAFSNPKAVFKQGLIGKYTTRFLPPHGNPATTRMLKRQIGL